MREAVGCLTRKRELVPAIQACSLTSSDMDSDVPAFPLGAFAEVQAAVLACFAAFQAVQVQFLEGRILLGNASLPAL